MSYRRRGFTIIELLVIIVVVSILIAVTFVSYVGVQQRAFTSKVAATVNTYTKLLSLYKAQYGDYPSTGSASGSACLGLTTHYPAVGLMPQNICSYYPNGTGTNGYTSASLNTLLLAYTSTLPDGSLPIVNVDNDWWTRGIVYLNYIDRGTHFIYIIYVLKGISTCPAGITMPATSSADGAFIYCKVDLT